MSYFPDILNQALSEIGCDTSRFHFDAHSTIAMSFTDIGDILIVPRGERFLIWNEITDIETHMYLRSSERVLELLLLPCPYFEGETMGLRAGEPAYWAGGLLDEAYASDAGLLAEALADYHDRLTRLRAMVR